MKFRVTLVNVLVKNAVIWKVTCIWTYKNKGTFESEGHWRSNNCEVNGAQTLLQSRRKYTACFIFYFMSVFHCRRDGVNGNLFILIRVVSLKVTHSEMYVVSFLLHHLMAELGSFFTYKLDILTGFEIFYCNVFKTANTVQNQTLLSCWYHWHYKIQYIWFFLNCLIVLLNISDRFLLITYVLLTLNAHHHI